MVLNVNKYANVILERSLRANEYRIGVNDSKLTIMKDIWRQINGYFLDFVAKSPCAKLNASHLFIHSHENKVIFM